MFKTFFHRLRLNLDGELPRVAEFDFLHMGGDNDLIRQAASAVDGVTIVEQMPARSKLHALNTEAQRQFYEQLWLLEKAKKNS